MLKPRLIFTLLYAEGVFNVSRNFNLQKIGDLDWLKENYEFESIARSIDELIILNVNRQSKDFDRFLTVVEEISSFSFMPLALGGGVRNYDQASQLFQKGADKLVVNTAFFSDEALINKIVQNYGSQALVASVDFRRSGNSLSTFMQNGEESTGMDLVQTVERLEAMGAGEIYVSSIERDGTGIGYDLEALRMVYESCSLPIIASGGADTYDKLTEGIKTNFVSGVSTSHLFNFMGDGLQDARNLMVSNGIALSNWDFNSF